ncbi:MAG: class I mannose-6-phosphate isomerase [Prevotella sp.]|nr:class I mannose-6-phosphate isomerase [Prevotella sp.]
MRLYPFLFEPNLHSVVWGGDAITKWKGLPDVQEPIGESWEVSAVPTSTSIIANGELKGKDLISVLNEYPEEILGEEVSRQYDRQLPLLVKFIDARKDLSIQVHPNDAMAQRLHQKRGKTEMWYVIDAKPGAFLYAGFGSPLAPLDENGEVTDREAAMEAYRRHVANGTITEVLAKHEVKAGDVFYLPAGRVHAICSGILLAEVQQSSDVTYRIFDYNRPGMDGNPRELHTELAAEALDYQVVDTYRTTYDYQPERANLVIDSPFFNVRVIDVNGPFHRNLIKYDSFIITMCIHGNCRIRMRDTGDEIMLREGYSTLISASIADYDIIPDNIEGKSQILDAFIDNKTRDLGSRISRFLHLTRK